MLTNICFIRDIKKKCLADRNIVIIDVIGFDKRRTLSFLWIINNIRIRISMKVTIECVLCVSSTKKSEYIIFLLIVFLPSVLAEMQRNEKKNKNSNSSIYSTYRFEGMKALTRFSVPVPFTKNLVILLFIQLCSIVNRFLFSFSFSLVLLIPSSYFRAHIICWFPWTLVLPKMPITIVSYKYSLSFFFANVWLRLMWDLNFSTFYPIVSSFFFPIWNASGWSASLSSYKIMRK